MDSDLITALAAAGIDTTLRQHVPTIGVPSDEQGRPVPPEADEWLVHAGGRAIAVRLKMIRDLWSGNAEAPDLTDGPTREYVPFFATIELTAADYCALTETRVTDKEFERLYSLLRRRPDGSDGHPLFAFLQAAARLYMSMRATSQAEFEAVARRLERSARTFAMGWTSLNYTHHVLAPLHGGGRKA